MHGFHRNSLLLICILWLLFNSSNFLLFMLLVLWREKINSLKKNIYSRLCTVDVLRCHMARCQWYLCERKQIEKYFLLYVFLFPFLRCVNNRFMCMHAHKNLTGATKSIVWATSERNKIFDLQIGLNIWRTVLRCIIPPLFHPLLAIQTK